MKITKSVLEKLGNYIPVVPVNIIINCSDIICHNAKERLVQDSQNHYLRP